MPRRPPVAQLALTTGAVVLLLLAGLLVVLLVARDREPVAAGPVDVPVPAALPTGARTACAELLAALPDALPDADGEPAPRREVTDPALSAAWGSPALTLVCGAEPPLRAEPPFEVSPDDGPFEAFTVRDVGAATRFTTSGRRPVVAVEVPDDAFDSTALQRLVPALRTLPAGEVAPTG